MPVVAISAAMTGFNHLVMAVETRLKTTFSPRERDLLADWWRERVEDGDVEPLIRRVSMCLIGKEFKYCELDAWTESNNELLRLFLQFKIGVDLMTGQRSDDDPLWLAFFLMAHAVRLERSAG